MCVAGCTFGSCLISVLSDDDFVFVFLNKDIAFTYSFLPTATSTTTFNPCQLLHARVHTELFQFQAFILFDPASSQFKSAFQIKALCPSLTVTACLDGSNRIKA